MQSCTECGTAISPAVGPPVLMNGKVVCQPCWQRLGADAAPEAASAPARPTTQSSRAAASRRSVSSTAPAPVRRQTSTTPAARRSSSREPAPSRGTSRARPAEESPPSHRATSRTAALIEEVESAHPDRMKLYIIIAMCVMVLAAAIAGFLWKSKRDRDARDAQQATLESDAAMAEVEQLMQKDPENYEKIIDTLNKAEPKMKLFPVKKSKIQSYQSEWINKRDASQSKKANIELIEALEKEVQDPTKLASVRLKIDAAKRAGSSLAQAGFKEWGPRVEKIVSALSLNTLKEAFDAAKAKETSGNVPEALAAYDEAVVKFNKTFDQGGGTGDAPTIELFKQLLAESDKLVERVETPEFESQVPERDMLSTKERQPWGFSAGSKLTWSGREMSFEGVPIDRGKVTGVVSMLPPKAAPWHDIVLDLEFTILSGEFEMYLRYWPDKRSYKIKFDAPSGYEPNKPYRMTIHVKGSSVSLKQPEQPENRDKMDPTTSRTGGVGFGVNPGSKVIISVCKLKVLRPKG
jgi:hypothetical protein